MKLTQLKRSLNWSELRTSIRSPAVVLPPPRESTSQSAGLANPEVCWRRSFRKSRIGARTYRKSGRSQISGISAGVEPDMAGAAKLDVIIEISEVDTRDIREVRPAS